VKYLQKKFSLSFSSPHEETLLEGMKRRSNENVRRYQLQHEFVNMGGMCAVCSLGR
jgi:hypothetical protein